MPRATRDATNATTLTAPMLLSREALRQAMIPARSGSIQFFSSAAAKTVLRRKAHYAAAKLALLPLARTLALEVGDLGIRVNTLVLGAVEGDLVDAWLDRESSTRGIDRDEVLRAFTAGSALARMVTPDEVADVSLWLASDSSSAITGQDLNVTAGDATR
jgi:3-hydroxybutyrate dehydrogenase